MGGCRRDDVAAFRTIRILWHDRAAFHFLTEENDRQAYVSRLMTALRHGGQVIIGTFSLDGPQRCSGLPVMRYDVAGLAAVLGPRFRLLASRVEEHRTPWGASQIFQFSRFLIHVRVKRGLGLSGSAALPAERDPGYGTDKQQDARHRLDEKAGQALLPRPDWPPGFGKG